MDLFLPVSTLRTDFSTYSHDTFFTLGFQQPYLKQYLHQQLSYPRYPDQYRLEIPNQSPSATRIITTNLFTPQNQNKRHNERKPKLWYPSHSYQSQPQPSPTHQVQPPSSRPTGIPAKGTSGKQRTRVAIKSVELS